MSDVSNAHATCWTLIQGAAAGNRQDRSSFSHRYLPVVREYFAARWKRTPLAHLVDDAVQEVFLECFREHGALERADPARPRGFRVFLFGVVTNVARRVERRWTRQHARQEPGSFHPEEFATSNDRLSQLFDREWAISIIRHAGELQQGRADAADHAARRRVELLRLRHEEGLTIQEIAARWNENPETLHQAYRRARKEYRECLREAVAYHHPGARAEIDRECRQLLSLLQ